MLFLSGAFVFITYAIFVRDSEVGGSKPTGISKGWTTSMDNFLSDSGLFAWLHSSWFAELAQKNSFILRITRPKVCHLHPQKLDTVTAGT